VAHWRIHVQPDDVSDLGIEFWVGGELERLLPPWLQVPFPPDPGDGGEGDPQLPGQQSRRPVFQRALEVQAALATRSGHRGAALPDLLIAATAERHRVTVLHYDHEYDLIASVTGQPTHWIVPRGTADAPQTPSR